MGITRLGHVGLIVSDVDGYARWLSETLAARIVWHDEGETRLALNSREHQIRLRAGAATGCDSLGFDVSDREALDALRERVLAAGLETADEAPAPAEAGFRFQIPNGPAVELCLEMPTAPTSKGLFDPYRIATRPASAIRKLGHVTVGAPDPSAVEAIFVEVLGFRISDRFPGVLSWARCNADHHSVGFAPAEAPGLHHIAYEIESFAHYEAFADHLVASGTRLVWGPGRHGPGNNLFAYFEDPVGNLIEIYCDLIQIENEHDYVASEWTDLQQVGNSWGPLPDESWFKMLTPFVTEVVAR